MSLRPFRPAAALAAVAVFTTACFSGAPQAGGDGGGDRLRVGLPFPPVAAMSPFSDDAVIATRMGVVETLIALDADGQPQPALAESWEHPDDLTWLLTLRPGVTFHDGTALTAEVAADSLTRATQASPTPRSLADTALTVAAEGENTLVITTAAPDPVLPQRLSSPELMVLAPAAYADPARPTPVRAGTGPFVLEELAGTSTARLERFDGYRDGPAVADGADVRFIAEGAARANALRAGELDIAQTIPVSQVATITEQEIRSVPLPRTVTAYLNQSSATFVDPALRAAARDAFATVDAAPTIYEGQADPAVGLFGPASPFAADRPAVTETPAGVPSGQAIRLATYSDRPELPEVAAAAADALRAAGFAVEVIVQEYSTIEPQLLDGTFDIVLATRSYQIDTGDPVGYLASDFTCAGSYNLSQHCDPSIDAAVAAAGAQVDPAARQEAALQIESSLLAGDVVAPVVHERTRIGVAPGVTGVAEDPFERILITGETATT